jgi:hypothetical protein
LNAALAIPFLGEQLSEHGRANAVDVRSFKLANGAVIELFVGAPAGPFVTSI